jgi:protein-disulfide isomerase
MIKPYSKIKKIFLFSCILFSMIFSLKSYADDLNLNNKNIVLGQDDAVVKIKIFSSFTCPHCANFHFKIIPEIKKLYIDNGKVQLIFIDFPLDQAAFNASKLLHCVDKDKRMNVMDIIYEEQTKWASSNNINEINDNLKTIAKDFGINSNQFDNCITNQTISDKILNNRIDAGQKYSISSTPTIVINEKKLEESVNFENIKKKIEKII